MAERARTGAHEEGELARLRADLANALEREKATAEVLSVISRLQADVRPVFGAILDSAIRLCGADQGAILKFESNELDVVEIRPNTHEVWSLLRESYPRPADKTSLNGQAVLEKRTFHVPDLNDPAAPVSLSPVVKGLGFRSQLTVPLLRAGDPIGVLALQRRTAGLYTPGQVALVETFADQAVIAIENARLLEEVQQSLQQQTATAEVLKAINASPGDLRPVFETMLAKAMEASNAHLGILWTYDGEAFTIGAELGTPSPRSVFGTGPMRATSATGLGRVVTERRVVHIHDVLDDVYYAGDAVRVKTVEQLRARTWLGVPLLKDGNVLGVFTIYRSEVRPFSDREIALLASFAEQAVIAIENARLLEEVQARTDELKETLEHQTATSEVLSVISRSPTQLAPVLDAILDTARRLCAAHDAAILLRENDLLASVAHSGPIPADTGGKWPISRGWVTGRAVVDCVPVHVADLQAEHEEFPEGRSMALRQGHRTILAVPMVRADVAIGAIVSRRAEVDPFSEKQIRLLQNFADQAVIAIGNVRLFEQVQARTEELARSLDELRSAQDRLIETQKLAALGQLTAGVAHEIKNPLNFINNFADLSAELAGELEDALKPPLADGALADATDLATTIRANLQKVVEHGRRADSIVKNMLLHSREGSGERSAIDLNATAQESLNLAYHGARAENPSFNVRLATALDPNVGSIDAYPQELVRVLLNLISNAFHAAHKRQRDVGDPSYEPEVTVSTQALPQGVEIRVRDNGTGIPEEVRAKMFDPFFTTKPPGEGTGLGLSLSHDIVTKQHGGRIDVDSRVGEFTEFVVTLPR